MSEPRYSKSTTGREVETAEIATDRNCRGFVSQGLQDVFLYTVLWRHLTRPGVYVDLAAHDFRLLAAHGGALQPTGTFFKGPSGPRTSGRRLRVLRPCILSLS